MLVRRVYSLLVLARLVAGPDVPSVQQAIAVRGEALLTSIARKSEAHWKP